MLKKHNQITKTKKQIEKGREHKKEKKSMAKQQGLTVFIILIKLNTKVMVIEIKHFKLENMLIKSDVLERYQK